MDCPQCGAQNYTQEHDTSDHAPTCSLKLAQDKMNAEYAADAQPVLDGPVDVETVATDDAPVPDPEAQPPAE